MNNAPPLVHPDLLVALGAVGFFPHLCAIQEAVETQDATGQPIEVAVALPGKDAVPCRIAPALSGDNEVRRDALTVETVTHDVFLKDYYPDIVPKNLVFAYGTTYDILVANHDSQHLSTVLRTKVMTV